MLHLSVFKKRGRWAVRIDLDREKNGPRHRKSYGTYRTKAEAKAKEREVLNSRARGLDLSAQSTTVEEMVERYIQNCEIRCVGMKTIERYRELLRLQVNPHIGSLTLEKLRKAHVAEFIATLTRRGNTRTGAGLAPKTIKNTLSLLATSLEWAVEMEVIQYNPASRVRSPKVPKRTAKAIDEAEACRLLEYAEAEGSLWGRLFTISLTVGARRGEVAALKWSDIDWTAGTVTICRALSKTVTAGVLVKPTKTGNVRAVKLSPMALRALQSQHAIQTAEKLKNRDYQDASWVFANPLGETLNPVSISNAFKRIATAAEISTTRLHDLRHTFASWLIADGENIETVKDALGHSTSYTTLTTYAHAVKRATAAAVESIDARLSGRHGHLMATAATLAS